jgi:CheY-like chemotaxis protein
MSTKAAEGKLSWFVPRILVVENNFEDREDFAEILRACNYIVHTAEGSGDELITDAKQKAATYCYHVVLVDMRLLDDYDRNDWSGLDLITDLCLPTVSVVISAYGDRAAAVKAINDNKALNFVGKEEGAEALILAIAKAGQKAWMWKPDWHISWPLGLSSEEIVKKLEPDDFLVPHDEAFDLMRRLFPDARQLRIQSFDGPSRRFTTTPRQRSIILQVWQDDRPQPNIVKLARKPRIGDESERYKKFIAGRLRGHFCARLRGHELLWNLGGGVYDFLGVELDPMELFSMYYLKHPPTKIIDGLKGFFGKTWAALYHDRRPDQASTSLFAAYNLVWGTQWHDRLRNFPSKQALLTYTAISSDLQLPNPINWVVNHVGLGENAMTDTSCLPSTYIAVTHGDLFGDNVFVDENDQLWVIDYERTGWGPILQDFAELETDILTRLADFDNDLRNFFRLVTVILQPKKLEKRIPTKDADREVTKSLKVISAMRKLAHQQTGVQDARQYLWGLLLNTVFRASFLESDDPKLKRTLLLGSLICHRLEHWTTSWPPTEWNTVVPAPSPPKPPARVKSAQPQFFRIVVASPGDVQPERGCLEGVVAELNRGIAPMANLRLELMRWETDAYPGFHIDGPQGLLDPILRIEDADLLIGVFWKRFGTPVADANSGTEHEFRIAYDAWQRNKKPQIMMYFNQRKYMPQSPAESDQQRRVLQFKADFPSEGLWWSYNGKTQFERLVRNHLSQFIRQQHPEKKR